MSRVRIVKSTLEGHIRVCWVYYTLQVPMMLFPKPLLLRAEHKDGYQVPPTSFQTMSDHKREFRNPTFFSKVVLWCKSHNVAAGGIGVGRDPPHKSPELTLGKFLLPTLSVGMGRLSVSGPLFCIFSSSLLLSSLDFSDMKVYGPEI